MQKWKIVNKHLSSFIEKERLNKCLLNNLTNIQSQWRKSFKFIHPEKLFCWDLKNQFYQSVLFCNLQVIRDGLHLRNIGGSSSAWEYHLLMQPFGNIYSYSISNGICQQLTQHSVGHTPYKIDKQYTYYHIKNGG